MLKKNDKASQDPALPDHPAFEYLPGAFDRGVILLCDHARADLPGDYGDLGLAADQFERHIAYDIGARGVTMRMHELLGVPALLSRYSRLLIDINRGLDDPTLVMKISDGAVVPGNLDVDEAEKENRVERFHRPYHDAIDRLIDLGRAEDRLPCLISIHSFTPFWKGHARPWHASLLWDRDERLVRPFIERLSQESSLVIGDNVPYSGELEGDTLNRHGTGRGIAHALVEIRQDLIATVDGQLEWAERLARITEEILGDESFVPLLQNEAHGL